MVHDKNNYYQVINTGAMDVRDLNSLANIDGALSDCSLTITEKVA